MNKSTPQTLSQDEAAVHALIERWSAAVRARDYTAIRADHDDDMLMFDVPLPLQCRGIEAYMGTWDKFFGCWGDGPVTFNFTEITVAAGSHVAFATAIGHCASFENGQRTPLEFRLTMGLRKIGDRWTIIHEHHSVPAE